MNKLFSPELATPNKLLFNTTYLVTKTVVT